jgi:uncharacterized SAM-binding protein YcdF (DUF218 family)
MQDGKRPDGTRKLGRLIGRILLAGAVVWALTLGTVVIGATLLSRQTALPAPADAILCLGAGVAGNDPGLPDSASDRRAQHCATLHAAGIAPVVIFTGYGVPDHSAAEAMAARAIALGLPPSAALRETAAESTIQNAAFSLPLLPETAGRVILVSDAFHLPRAWVIFRLTGYEEVSLHVAPAIETATQGASMRRWILRETLAIWVNVARGAAYVVGGWAGVDRDTRIGWLD